MLVGLSVIMFPVPLEPLLPLHVNEVEGIVENKLTTTWSPEQNVVLFCEKVTTGRGRTVTGIESVLLPQPPPATPVTV